MNIPKFIKKNKEYILLSIILLFGAFIRIYALGQPPLWVDEAISGITAINIIEKGFPVLDSGILYGRAYLFHYLQAFFLLFGQTDFLVRFASVIIGLLTIVLAYFVGKEYSSKSGGIIAALFMAIFYLEVFYSRQARFYQLFQLLFFSSNT
jgi:mannosyltransferase